MAFELFNKEFYVGVAAAIPAALGGWAAFGRLRSANRAENANDSQRVNMLDRMEEENQRLRQSNAEKDALIREYFEASVKAEARLEALEQSMTHLREQNTQLSSQVRELTQANRDLTVEVTSLRLSIRGAGQ